MEAVITFLSPSPRLRNSVLCNSTPQADILGHSEIRNAMAEHASEKPLESALVLIVPGVECAEGARLQMLAVNLKGVLRTMAILEGLNIASNNRLVKRTSSRPTYLTSERTRSIICSDQYPILCTPTIHTCGILALCLGGRQALLKQRFQHPSAARCFRCSRQAPCQ